MMRPLLFLAATAAWLALPLHADDVPQPGPELGPREVVAIQLDALKHNNEPEPDAGIARAWAFAHPDNRESTGPLVRFAAMLKTPAYSPLLDHRQHSIEALGSDGRVAEFAVTLVAADGAVVAYRWMLRKVAAGRFEGAWMTVAVSPPMRRGEAI